MKSTKSKQYSTPQTTTKKINILVKKALKNKPNWKPSKGYKYIQDLKEGTMFKTGAGMRGVYLNSTPSSAQVIIVSCNSREEDKAYYLGKQNIANTTEVKEISS